MEDQNRRLSERTAAYRVEYQELVCRVGRQNFYDERHRLSVGLPIRSVHHLALAREWLRILAPVCGRQAKVVVTDLDNTLWGGVLEEGGLESGPVFQEFQNALLALRDKGFLLAVCSKNDREPVMQALETHPDLKVRAEHFSLIEATLATEVRGVCSGCPRRWAWDWTPSFSWMIPHWSAHSFARVCPR